MPRSKLEVADIFRRHGDAYRQKHDASLSTVQRRVMTAIELCRTAALGGHVEQCDHCGCQRISYNSCRNRHCPKCQSLARARWLDDRRSEVLDTEYFHVVFTMPKELAAIAYQNKELVYGILFRAAADTLRIIAADPKHLGAEIGFFAVLHTWGQNLLHHPHLHCVIPGGGLIVTRGKSLQDNMRDLVRRFLDERHLDKLDDLRAWGYDPTSKQRAFINKQTTRKTNPLSFREAFTNKFVADKFGEATTHWRKLEDRVHRGVGNPCPLVLIGLPDSIVTFHEGMTALVEVEAAEAADDTNGTAGQ